MLDLIVHPSKVSGILSIPPSKSQTLRAILFGSLSPNISYVHGYLKSPDTESMIQACQQFGAVITKDQNTLVIQGTSFPKFDDHTIINAGNSGIVLRFLTTIAALHSKNVLFTGENTLQNRPIDSLLSTLKQLGASVCKPKNSKYLFSISGPITPGKAHIIGSDSQFISALIIMAPLLTGPLFLNVSSPKELPWINLSLKWLDRLQIPYTYSSDYKQYEFSGNHTYPSFSYRVPGDFSSAAFPAAAGICSGNSYLQINNLNTQSSQGDKKLFSLWEEMGAKISYEENSIHIQPSELIGADIDMDLFIDALPILSVMCCFAKTPSKLYNASSAQYKECNRILCTAKELNKMHAKISIIKDGLIIYPSQLKGSTLSSHNDHRLAMSLTIAALKAEDSSIIQSCNCINKTFPLFVKTMQSINANIQPHEHISMRAAI